MTRITPAALHLQAALEVQHFGAEPGQRLHVYRFCPRRTRKRKAALALASGVESC